MIILLIYFGSKGAEERLKEMLNALLYPGIYPKKIRSLKFLPNDINNLIKKKDKNSLITDILCQIMVDGQEYVVDIEMRIGDRDSLNKRFINYGTSLRNNNSFKGYLTLGISVSSKVQSNYTNQKKKNFNQTTDLDYLKTIQINIDNELKRIENGESVEINGKNLKDDGKEFLKLLGLKNWATEAYGYKFALPEWDISDNSKINQCIKNLSEISDSELAQIIMDEQYFEDIQKENYKAGFNIGLIIGAFENFLKDKENKRAFYALKYNNAQVNGEDEIREILKEKEKSDVDNFIEYLKNYKFF